VHYDDMNGRAYWNLDPLELMQKLFLQITLAVFQLHSQIIYVSICIPRFQNICIKPSWETFELSIG
jgi:hypothetical protein